MSPGLCNRSSAAQWTSRIGSCVVVGLLLVGNIWYSGSLTSMPVRPSEAGHELRPMPHMALWVGRWATHLATGMNRLLAYPLHSPVEIDGRIDPEWEVAPALAVPLHRGSDDRDLLHAIVRAKYDRDRLYLLVQWPEAPPQRAEGAVNKLTVHWEIETQAVHCSVGCHTAYITPDHRVRVLNAETIPPDPTRHSRQTGVGTTGNG